jgi:hypothetical protein
MMTHHSNQKRLNLPQKQINQKEQYETF